MHGVGLPDGFWSRLGESEIPDLAGLHELPHCADGLLDGGLRVDAVLVVEVYVVYPEARKRRVAGLPYVVGLAAHAEKAPVFAANVAELGGENDLVPAVGYGFADELLVGERAVHVRRVQERYAKRY